MIICQEATHIQVRARLTAVAVPPLPDDHASSIEAPSMRAAAVLPNRMLLR